MEAHTMEVSQTSYGSGKRRTLEHGQDADQGNAKLQTGEPGKHFGGWICRAYGHSPFRSLGEIRIDQGNFLSRKRRKLFAHHGLVVLYVQLSVVANRFCKLNAVRP